MSEKAMRRRKRPNLPPRTVFVSEYDHSGGTVQGDGRLDRFEPIEDLLVFEYKLVGKRRISVNVTRDIGQLEEV